MAKKKAKPDFSKPKENNQTAQENKKNSFDDSIIISENSSTT